MASSQALPASFAVLWEQLGVAHKHELSDLREENFRMRCRLVHTEREYPCCGTFEDKDGRVIRVGAVGDSIVVAFPTEQAQLTQGNVNVFGIAGQYRAGLLAWDNGDRWRKTHDAASRPFTEEDAEAEGAWDGMIGRMGWTQNPRESAGDEEDGAPAPEEGGFHPDRGEKGEDIPRARSTLSRENARRKLPPLKREGTWSSVSEAMRNFASPRKKERLPFSKARTAGPNHDRCQCRAYLILRRAVRSPWFEAIVWALIVFSAIMMAAELQYVGNQLGNDLNYAGYDTPAAEQYPGAADVFEVMEWVFGISFTVYLILKLAVYRTEFFCGRERLWNISDVIIVTLWWIWQIEHTGDGDGIFKVKINPQILRVFRLSRLIRHLKMVRQFMTFDALHVMTTALKGSLHVFMWAVLLLLLFQTILTLLLTSTIQEFYLGAHTDDIKTRGEVCGVDRSCDSVHEVYEYFGTFTRTFLTMFELTLANWPVASRVLTEHISEWWTVFAILHKLTMGFALVGIINGVFMQETFKVAAMDDRIMLRQKQAAHEVHESKMRALFQHLDTSHDGKVDIKEFQMIVNDKQVKDWLAAQDITVTDADSLFKLIAGHEDAEITSDELIFGLGRMKGTVRTLDFMLLRQQVWENNNILRQIAGMPQP